MLTLCYTAAFLASVSMAVVFLALPFVAIDRFGALNFHCGLLAAAGAGCYVCVSLMSGRISERLRIRTQLTASTLVLTLSFYAIFHAPSFPVLVLLNVINGTAMGFLWAPLEAVVSRLSPPNRVRANMGWYNLSWSLGMAVGYFIYWVLPALETWAFHFGSMLFLLTCALFLFLRAPDAGARPLHADGDASRMPFDGRRRFFLLISWSGVFVAYIGVGAARSLFQKLGTELELTKQTVSLICGFGLIAQTITMATMGRYEAWHYRKWVVFVGELGLIAAGLSIAIGSNVAVFSMGHVLLGIGMSMIYSSSLFYSMEDQAHAHRNTSIHEGLLGMGHTVLPFIGFAADSLRFTPLTFYIVAGLALLLLPVQIMAFYVVRSSWESEGGKS